MEDILIYLFFITTIASVTYFFYKTKKKETIHPFFFITAAIGIIILYTTIYGFILGVLESSQYNTPIYYTFLMILACILTIRWMSKSYNKIK